MYNVKEGHVLDRREAFSYLLFGLSLHGEKNG